MKCCIAEASESVKIGVITDIHKCSAIKNDSITTKLLNKFNSSVNFEATDFNIDLGDNISYRVNECSHTANEDLEWVINNLNTVSPLYHTLSDHDIDDKKMSITFRNVIPFCHLEMSYLKNFLKKIRLELFLVFSVFH